MPDIEDRDHDETITIHIHENQETHRFDGEVTVGVNGTVVKVPIGSDTTSTVAVASALQAAGIQFSEVTPQGETGSAAGGVSAADTSFIAGEGDVDKAQADASQSGPTSPPDAPVPELSQTDLAGQIANAKEGGPRADNGLTVAETPADTDGETKSDDQASEQSPSDAPADDSQEGQPTDQSTVDTAPIDQPIPALVADIQGVKTADEINALIDYEKAGSNRSGALKALEARKAEIEAEAHTA